MKANHVPECAGAALAPLLASVRVPVGGPFLGLLTPLPFLYSSAKLGVSQAVKFTCISILAAGLIAAGFSLFLSVSPLRLVAVNAPVIILAIHFKELNGYKKTMGVCLKTENKKPHDLRGHSHLFRKANRLLYRG